MSSIVAFSLLTDRDCPPHADAQPKLIEVDGTPVLLEVTSYATQDWITFPRILARHSDGLMLVYSVKSRQSFERLVWWDEQIRAFKDGEFQQIPEREERERKRKLDFPVVMLVGNKCDAEGGEREVSRVGEFDPAFPCTSVLFLHPCSCSNPQMVKKQHGTYKETQSAVPSTRPQRKMGQT